MKISIIHPSRGRAEQCGLTLWKWIGASMFTYSHEYILSIDEDDQEIEKYKNIWMPGNYMSNIKIIVNKNKSAIEAINKAAEICTGDLIIVISDDFDCCGHWDLKLQGLLKDKSDFIVKTKDGIQPTLITLPIMDRVYYERFGYVYYPGYAHMFSDKEMTAVGHMLGRVINVDLEFKHNHYSVGGMVKDAINTKNDATWSQGQNLFNQRLKSNFGLKDSEIVKPYSDIVWR